MISETSDGAFFRVSLTGHSAIDFDGRIITKALRRGGNDVRNEARRLLARKAISGPGEIPGQHTGRLKRSIQMTDPKGKSWVRISPQKTNGMKAFYPAFLYYGVTGKPRRKDHKAQIKDGSWRVAPRANFMVIALTNKRSAVRAVIREALPNALKPR